MLLALATMGCGTIEDLEKQLRAQGEPMIRSVFPAKASVGDAFGVRGFNFGLQAGAIGIKAGPRGTMVPASVLMWSDDVITAKVPEVSILDQEVGIVVATADGRQPPFVARITIAKAVAGAAAASR